MGFFSKRKNENNGFIINTDDESIKISGEKNIAPHAITPEEVSDLWVFNDIEEKFKESNALDSLKKRMNVSKQDDAEKKESTAKVESKILETNETISDLIKQVESAQKTDPDSVVKSEGNDKTDEKPQKIIVKPKKTLVEKVKRYTIDEQGHDTSKNEEPIYKLQTVAEILMNDGESALKDLSKKYGLDIVVDDLDKQSAKGPQSEKENDVKENSNQDKQKPISKSSTTPTPAFEKMVQDSEKRESQELFESLFPSEEKAESPDISVPDISDIDTHEVGIENDGNISNTATIRFTPIKDKKGNTDHITISSITKHIDLSDSIPQDIFSNSVPELEESEFENFEPNNEYTDNVSGKKILFSLAKNKRHLFISSLISLAMVISLAVFLIPAVYNFILSSLSKSMIICTSFLFVSTVANYDMFLDFKNFAKKRCGFDVLTSLCSVLTLALGITAIITSENAYYSILLCSVILFTRVFLKFKETSAKHKSLRQIMGDKQKNAVALIDDPATTFAMAKNAIEGDVLIAAPKKIQFVENFMKHYEFHKPLSGKINVIFYVALTLSLISALMAYFIQGGVFASLYAASCIAVFAALPTAFLVETLAFLSVSKRLSTGGSMIAGLYGAEKIENANAAVVNIKDIFPSGTINMHSMRVLSENNIDDILLRAASLTSAVGSPLEPIFKAIAGTNQSYSIPDSDTVKYEKNLGISGWVNDELLFIGNRSLMLAHGIDIPSLEVDKKILRKGYFPVYVATENTACALIVIQYNVDEQVAKLLHKITNLGVTLLVENCDPNVTEEMLCDYFGIYDDSVKIMSSAGIYMYHNAVPLAEKYSAPAVFRGSGLNFIKIVNFASGIKRCNRLLTILYTLFAVFGTLYFIYAAFSGLMSMPTAETVLIYAVGTTILSIIGFLIRKP
ncbi:MAG: hypothetical protein IKJ93_03820 [Clostridia bacterium]|nr:hypothetical protein [Clostridia bacterium]